MRRLCVFMAAVCLAALTACGGYGAAGPVELIVFAPSSLEGVLEEIRPLYAEAAPGVVLRCSYASSGDHFTQIVSGAACDLFISASPKQMNALDALLAGGPENPDALDMIDGDTRLDLLETQLVLAAPEEGDIAGLDQMAVLLAGGRVRLVVGSEDVPAGQYARAVLAYYGMDPEALAPCLTSTSSGREAATRLAQGMADYGLVYATDALAEGLTVLDRANPAMCGRVVYPAAVLTESRHPEEAAAFLDYLTGLEAAQVFARAGFTNLQRRDI